MEAGHGAGRERVQHHLIHPPAGPPCSPSVCTPGNGWQMQRAPDGKLNARRLPECKRCPAGFASGPDAPQPHGPSGQMLWMTRRAHRLGAMCVSCPSKLSNEGRTQCLDTEVADGDVTEVSVVRKEKQEALAAAKAAAEKDKAAEKGDDESKAEDSKAEDPKEANSKAEDSKVEESKAEESKEEESNTVDSKADKSKADEAKEEESKAEESKADDTAAKEAEEDGSKVERTTEEGDEKPEAKAKAVEESKPSQEEAEEKPVP
jgi:hypothetical protein